MSTFPDQNKQTAPQFFRKLGIYLLGIAIGFMLLGLFQQLRRIEAQNRADAAKAAAEKAAATPSPFPPPPGSDNAPQPTATEGPK